MIITEYFSVYNKNIIFGGLTMKKLVSLFLLIVIMSTFVACNNSSKTSKTGEKVTLRMIESLTSPARTQLLQELIDKYEKEHPNVTIELISPPLKNADDKINQMLMAKQDLDIVEVREQTAQQFINNDYIYNMDEYVKSWDEYDTLTETTKYDISRIGDGSFLIPYGFYQRMLYYRKDWFEEAGIKVPTTYKELYEAGKALTDPTKNRYGYSFRGSAGGHWYIDMMIQAEMGDKLDVDEGYFTTDGKTIFGQPEAVEALKAYKKLYTDISAKDSLNWSYPEMVQGFNSGVTAMLIQDPEVVMACTEKMDEGTWATAPLPVGSTGIAYGPMGYAGWGITSYSKNKDVAWDFIAFISSAENNTYFCKNHALVPIHLSASEDEFFSSGYFAPYIEMASRPDEFKAAFAPFTYEGWGKYNKKADDDLQKMLLGQMSEEEVAADWDKYWTEQKANKK